MSLRNLRKVYGGPTIPTHSSDEDEDYEPLYVHSARAKYEGLVLSSDSSNQETHNTTDDDSGPQQATVKQNKKKQKKNKKKKKRSASSMPNPQNGVELDEIDRSVMEVNALLGSPAPLPEPVVVPPRDPEAVLLAVTAKHLHVENEMKRLFGPDEDEKKRKQRNGDKLRLAKRSVIVPIPERFLRVTKIGLSMSLLRRDDEHAYFAFDHSREYQKKHLGLLLTPHLTNEIILPGDDPLSASHVESIIESADKMFKVEEYLTANKLLEQAIAYMQYVAHPCFCMFNKRTRLEYEVLENRPFHVVMLKYAYLVSNRACHRTALEICKMLLNLEPTDPLAVLFCIDVFAIRAREHEWLIEAVDLWRKTRDADFMFNLMWSYALAKYHVVTQNKEDIKIADEVLHKTILQFPTMVIEIIKCASLTPSSRLLAHPLYTLLGSDTTSRSLQRLIHLHAQLTWHKWREPGVWDWFMRNAIGICDIYDKDLEFEAEARAYSQQRIGLFRGWPSEISRHISVILPMSSLIAEGAVPHVNLSRSFDPLPPSRTINRYRYLVYEDVTLGTGNRSMPPSVPNTFLDFVASVLPGFQPRHATPDTPLLRRGEAGVPEAPMVPPRPPPDQPPLPLILDNSSDDDTRDPHAIRRSQEADVAAVADEIAQMSPNDVSATMHRVRAYLDGFELGLTMSQYEHSLAAMGQGTQSQDGEQPGQSGLESLQQLEQEIDELQHNIPTAPASEDGTSDDQHQPPPPPPPE